MSGIGAILDICQTIESERTGESVFHHLCGEIIELSHEVRGTGDGIDGVIGESVDVILCAIDLIYQKNPTVTEDDINRVIQRKLEKWQTLYGQQEKQQ